MPVRSIIDIDLDDSAFQRHVAEFNRYQDAVRRLPASWNAVKDEQTQIQKLFADTAATILMAVGGMERATTAGEHLERTSASTGRHWAGLARTSKEVAGNLLLAANSLVRWTGLGTLATGLLGGGGLWGLDVLARSATGLWRGSSGLVGTTPGQMQSFGAYGALVGDSRAFLRQIADFQTSIAGASNLTGLGIYPDQLRGGTADVGSLALQRAYELARRTDPRMLQDVFEGRNLGWVDPGLQRTLHNLTPEQFGEFQGMQQKARSRFPDLGKETWEFTKLNTQLHLAGEEIESVFIKGLGRPELLKSLTDLSDAAVSTVQSLIGGEGFKLLIDDATVGLKRFSAYISTKEFGQDVERFTTNVGRLARAVEVVVNFIGEHFGFIGGAATGAAVGGSVAGPVGAVVGGGAGAVAGGLGTSMPSKEQWANMSFWQRLAFPFQQFGHLFGDQPATPPTGGGQQSDIGSLGSTPLSTGRLGAADMHQTLLAAGASPTEANFLTMAGQRESIGGQNIYNYKHSLAPDYYTASGYWQLIRGNWREYGPGTGLDALSGSPLEQAQAALRTYRANPHAWDLASGGSIRPSEHPSGGSTVAQYLGSAASASDADPHEGMRTTNRVGERYVRHGGVWMPEPQPVNVSKPSGIQVHVSTEPGSSPATAANQAAY